MFEPKDYLGIEEKKNGGIERKKGQFDVIGWLIRQNEYAKYAERNRLLMAVRAGKSMKLILALT